MRKPTNYNFTADYISDLLASGRESGSIHEVLASIVRSLEVGGGGGGGKGTKKCLVGGGEAGPYETHTPTW